MAEARTFMSTARSVVQVMRPRKWVLIFANVVAFATLTAIAVYRFQFPHGSRPACLPIMLQALSTYSASNQGKYPYGNGSSFAALLELYPSYLVYSEPLAGLCGDRELLKRDLAKGFGLSSNSCSWIYWPGLRSDDDPEIALIWERESGIGFNGQKMSGHAVGFIGGDMRQVPDRDWDEFVRRQEIVRGNALRNRTNK